MELELQGFGLFEIKKDKYTEFVEFLELDMDVFLNMVSIFGIGAMPILCLNFEKMESEGPIPLGYIKTEIGINRINHLIENEIISTLG
jgi:hypothetical protein